DQHRGWFHSSLLESCGTRGRAPYEGVLTHGFVMAEDGRKMSKSLGNIVSPQDVTKQYGAETLRLWVVASDYSEDLRVGPEIIKRQVDMYRRLRNTMRYLLGNLNEFDASERVRPAEMPELERWVLHRLWELDALVRHSCSEYDFHRMFRELHDFCAVDLSAFYFDIRKDSLYCDPASSLRRRAARTVLDHVFHALTKWLAPILVFTAEEVWQTRFPDENDSVHLQPFADVPSEWRDEALEEKWSKVRNLRRVVNGALELERREKRIGSSMQAAPKVYVDDQSYLDAFEGVNLSEVVIASGGSIEKAAAPVGAFTLDDVAGIAVVPDMAVGEKCNRCWMVLPDVGANEVYDDLCPRCVDAVDAAGGLPQE
ncbi:MAG: class I tRNA ligase family protein, partial [Sphingomonadales bacterium]|nr:class I tRNA ligase family protein [Sphingomonadales bacterium]